MNLVPAKEKGEKLRNCSGEACCGGLKEEKIRALARKQVL